MYGERATTMSLDSLRKEVLRIPGYKRGGGEVNQTKEGKRGIRDR